MRLITEDELLNHPLGNDMIKFIIILEEILDLLVKYIWCFIQFYFIYGPHVQHNIFNIFISNLFCSMCIRYSKKIYVAPNTFTSCVCSPKSTMMNPGSGCPAYQMTCGVVTLPSLSYHCYFHDILQRKLLPYCNKVRSLILSLKYYLREL